MKSFIATMAGAGLVLVAGGAMAAETTMRCSHQLPPKHHIAQVIDRWAAEVEAQSAGAIDVEV
ncbi:MAG: C4-dicarboxylate ABC transporter, partial [Rhodospirillales bacterium]|nr:C4-dicarboxylate ABC transporter [Rhodospirillales bacterium]